MKGEFGFTEMWKAIARVHTPLQLCAVCVGVIAMIVFFLRDKIPNKHASKIILFSLVTICFICLVGSFAPQLNMLYAKRVSTFVYINDTIATNTKIFIPEIDDTLQTDSHGKFEINYNFPVTDRRISLEIVSQEIDTTIHSSLKKFPAEIKLYTNSYLQLKRVEDYFRQLHKAMSYGDAVVIKNELCDLFNSKEAEVVKRIGKTNVHDGTIIENYASSLYGNIKSVEVVGGEFIAKKISVLIIKERLQ